MIVGFFLKILYILIAFIVGLLPIVSMPTEWTDALVLIWGYINSFSFLFPVATLLSVLTFALGFHVALLGYDLSLKLFHMLRGR